MVLLAVPSLEYYSKKNSNIYREIYQKIDEKEKLQELFFELQEDIINTIQELVSLFEKKDNREKIRSKKRKYIIKVSEKLNTKGYDLLADIYRYAAEVFLDYALWAGKKLSVLSTDELRLLFEFISDGLLLQKKIERFGSTVGLQKELYDFYDSMNKVIFLLELFEKIAEKDILLSKEEEIELFKKLRREIHRFDGLWLLLTEEDREEQEERKDIEPIEKLDEEDLWLAEAGLSEWNRLIEKE